MRPSCLNSLFRPVSNIVGIGPKLSKLVEKLCGPYMADVLFHLPSHINHRPFIESAYQIKEGTLSTIKVTIIEHRKPPRKSQPYKITGQWNNTEIELVFFNYHADYLTKKLSVGKTYYISGKLERYLSKISMLHPDYMSENLGEIPEFEPVYPLINGISGKVVAKAVSGVIRELEKLPEWLDEAFKKQQNFMDWKDAILAQHKPNSCNQIEWNSISRLRLVYDELLANQLALQLARFHHKKQKGIALNGIKKLEIEVFKNIPFELTNAQKRVIEEIEKDLTSTDKMTRLLQGDVGSGKTVVALMSLLKAVDSGHQGVLMAPTDILANQHLKSIEKMILNLPVKVALLTGREKGKKREVILKELAEGKIDILIGTHAVFTEDVVYNKLGLVIVDEQHKFGVMQRMALTKKQAGVNLLVMTATPIPRTLALTSYGDMDISLLDEKPANRQPIETKVISADKVLDVMQKLHQKIQNTEEKTQVYWVCPLVEESEKSDLMAAEKRYESLQEIFGKKAGLVHGKMKGQEKDAIMQAFSKGEIDVLVATTVIEVGVDVPSATIMVIEHAERFGLAALHQLRGRVGRGSKQSVCLLLYGKQISETGRARLKVMRESENGFVIAEEDLRLRGAGELLGSKQSGVPEFKMADIGLHSQLLKIASQDAKTILSIDPYLETERGKALRVLLYLFQKDSSVLTLKA